MENLIVRVCVCGQKFVPPSVAPKATKCRSCHGQERQAAAKRADVLRRAAEAAKATEVTKGALKELFHLGHLPPSAVVRQNGRQMTIAWNKRSFTFYLDLPQAA